MDNQTVTLPAKGTRNGWSYDGKKERVNTLLAVGSVDGEQRRIVDARFWMARSANASRVYCSVWVSPRDGSEGYAGHGWAGGYGYHKESAALAEALDNAGIKLARDISGVGESAMREALELIASAVGFEDATVMSV